MKEFCEQHLDSEYKTFQTRLRKKKLYPAEVAYICWFLGMSCKEIFGAPYADLVLFQGKGSVPNKAKALWTQADKDERIRLLALIGLDTASIIPPEPPKPKLGPSKSAPKVTDQPVVLVTQQASSMPPKAIDIPFFEDIDQQSLTQGAPVEEGVPAASPDAMDGLYVETYD